MMLQISLISIVCLTELKQKIHWAIINYYNMIKVRKIFMLKYIAVLEKMINNLKELHLLNRDIIYMYNMNAFKCLLGKEKSPVRWQCVTIKK